MSFGNWNGCTRLHASYAHWFTIFSNSVKISGSTSSSSAAFCMYGGQHCWSSCDWDRLIQLQGSRHTRVQVLPVQASLVIIYIQHGTDLLYDRRTSPPRVSGPSSPVHASFAPCSFMPWPHDGPYFDGKPSVLPRL